jgi:hypothetical protein
VQALDGIAIASHEAGDAIFYSVIRVAKAELQAST